MIIKSKSLKNIITIFQYFIHGWKEIKKKTNQSDKIM
jgi:hypothetical protein